MIRRTRLGHCLTYASVVALGAMAFNTPYTSAAPKPKKPPAAAVEKPKENDATPAETQPGEGDMPDEPVVKRGKPGRGDFMNYGPFLSSSVQRPKVAKPNDSYFERDFVAIKGINVHVGNKTTACFDTDTCGLAGAWSGGFLDLFRTNLDNEKGDVPPTAGGALIFSTASDPGWAKAGSFIDKRPQDGGPLPLDWAHYHGLYRNGEKVIFSYSVGKMEVLEMDGSVADAANHVAVTRTIHVTASTEPNRISVCELKGGSGGVIPLAKLSVEKGSSTGPADTSAAFLSDGKQDTLVTVLNAPKGTMLESAADGRIAVNLPALGGPGTIKVVISTLPKADRATFADLVKLANKVEDPSTLCKGGPSLWPDQIVTHGERAQDGNAAYVVDTVPLPEDNKWKSWMRASGFDFFSDGRAAICTWSGDVWIVSGLDDTLSNITWKRYAAGMYEPLGLKIINDEIYVLGRDQITRLHDLNNDGEADYYENFCNAWPASPIYHAFSLDLQADSKGNLYYANCGNQALAWMRMKGDVFKIPKEGGTAEVIAHGLRAPNGMGMGPNDEISVSDNQGHWTPVDRINMVKPGGFYGYVLDPRREEKGHKTVAPDHYDPPLCWIPYYEDNSAGAQVWAGKNWGPLSNQMLCLSYGKSILMPVLQETVDGIGQAGVFKLPLKFEAGIMRARVDPKDGQVWVAGFKGWQTNSAKGACFQRVRYTGKPANMPVALHVLPTSITITFSDPLDPQLAEDVQSYGIEEWNYHWTSTYGSKDYKLSDPKAEGRDEVAVKAVKVSADHKTVTLETAPLKPVMQMSIEMHLKSADGNDIGWKIGNTINRVGGKTIQTGTVK